MSQDRRNDHDITPDWDDMDLSWLDDLDIGSTPKSSPARHEPGQTGFEPEQTPRRTDLPRQSPADPYQRPAPTRRQATPSRRQPEPSSRQAASARRQPAPSSHQAAPARRQPAAPSRQPTSTRRQPAAPSRQAASARRQPAARSAESSPWDREISDPAYRRRGRRRKSNAPLIILIVVLVAGMGFAGWQLGSIFLNYRRDRSAYNDLASSAISMLADFDDSAEGDGDDEAQSSSVSEIPISVDWDYLRSINANVAGWLYCPNTVISYPVVQTSDHEYYLTHGFNGESNTAGTLFADMNSVAGITQSNYIIYGHNMKDNSMFGTFANYVDESYYEQNPIMYYLTPDANYRIELLCAHVVESTLDNFPTYFSSVSDYQTYLNKITSNAYWVNYDIASTNYQLITMSTCSYDSGYEDPRFLVHGMLVPLE